MLSETLSLKKSGIFHNLENKIQFYEDPGGLKKIHDIESLPESAFQIYGKDTINFDITPSTFWIKMEVSNESEENDWLLEIGAPSVDFIQYYFINNKIRFSGVAGDENISAENTIISNYVYFPIPITPKESGKIYIAIRGHEILELPIRLGNRQLFHKDTSNREFFQGIYFGIVMIMALYNIFLFFILKDKAYLFYVFYILSIGFTSAYFSGYIRIKDIVYYSNLLSIFSAVFGILFSMNFLNTRTNSKWIHYIFLIYLLVFTITIIIELSGFRTFNTPIVYAVGMSSSFVCFGSGLYIYFSKKYLPSRFYVFSWFAFLLGLNIQILRAFGFLPYNLFTSHTLQIGNAIEILLLSFALADRINQYKKEHEESKERAIAALNSNRKLIVEQNKMLEEKVSERTAIIEIQKQELESRNKLLLNEIELAGKFQQTLLPNKPEKIPRVQLGYMYKPMLGVGGDFIDILYSPEKNHLGLFICDVTGHGITASLIASMVKIALRGWEKILDNPILIPDQIRDYMKDKLDKHFLTAGICSINLETLSMCYVNAGHPPIIHLDTNGKGKFISSKGRLIGSYFSPNSEKLFFNLQKGEKVILYTDGILESRNRRGEMLGEENFMKKLEELYPLSPKEMVGELSEFLVNFTNGKNLEDDVTILILEVEY